MSVRERIAALKREARDLERASDKQERADSYAEALNNERHGYEHRLARARLLGDKHEQVPDLAGNLRDAEQSGDEIAAMLETRIQAVDAELNRCGAKTP